MGAIINKGPNQKFGKTLLKGLGQGALGGYLVFESERLVREFARTGDYGYVWPSKFVNSAGTSIIENAAANRDFWARWHLNIGFNRLEVNTKENFRLSYRIMPFSLIMTGYSATQGEFDLKTSLRVGSFVFRSKPAEEGPYGTAPANSIILDEGIKGNVALPHEIIHTYQYERLSGFNSFFPTIEKKVSGKMNISEFYGFYKKVFYTDYNFILHSMAYSIADLQGYDDNFFENEAEYYTINSVRTEILRH